MIKLSNYTGEIVFIKELHASDGEYKSTEAAIKYIAFRKCLNVPHPSVYTNFNTITELDISDIEADLGIGG
jgi:hypothetical protein